MRNIGLIFSGSIITLIGIGHLFFPTFGYSEDVQSYLRQSPQIADHFYYLATYAICSFLLFMGTTTIYMGSLKDSAQNPQFIRFFIIMSIVLWSARLLMELKYPVKLSLFGISEPTNSLFIALSLIIIGFMVGLAKVLQAE